MNSSLFRFAVVTVYLILVWAWTKPTQQADTLFYGQSVVRLSKNVALGEDRFESGHLLWRPIGYGLWKALQPQLEEILPDEPLLQSLVVFKSICMVSTWLGAIMLISLLTRAGGAITGVTLSMAWITWNPILNYGQAGTSYVAGLCCLIFSVWCVANGLERQRKGILPWVWIWVGGVALAASALFWFTYILVAPAVAFLLLLWSNEDTGDGVSRIIQRLPFAAHLTLSCTIVLALAAIWVFAGMGFHSVEELASWFTASSHNASPPRSLLPLATAFPRAFLELGKDGLGFKRIVLQDPYAPVSWTKIALVATVRLLIPLLFLAAIAILIWYSRRSRRLGVVLIVGLAPMLMFALFLYEATSPERFLPMMPFFLLAMACVLPAALSSFRFWERALARFCVAFLVFAAVHNLYECARWNVNAKYLEAESRAEAIASRIEGKQSVVFLLFARDPLAHIAVHDPFNPLNRLHLPLREVFAGWGLPVNRDWQAGFAAQVDEQWSQCKEVWISRRLLAARPDPDWLWVEGENRAIPWASIPKFFNQWEIAESAGGADGFARLAPSEGNRSVIAGVLGKPAATCLRNGL